MIPQEELIDYPPLLIPQFIVETDGTRMASADLDDEDTGRWLWFRPSVVNELLGLRGFSL
jgi:hypothetical protein